MKHALPLLTALLLAPLAALHATAVSNAVEANLLTHPSFEKEVVRDGVSRPAGWEWNLYPGTVIRRVTDHARTGRAAGYIEVAAEGAAAFPLFRFDVPSPKPGECYRASAWARTEGVASAWGSTIGFEFHDAAGQRMPWVDGEQTGGGDRDWQRITVQAYVPEGAVRMMLTLGAHREGKTWFDDAELVRVSEPDAFAGCQAAIRVRPERPREQPFLGFGAHGDFFLTREINTRRGVDDADRKLVLDRVAALHPHLVMLFFDYKWWEPEPGRRTPDSEAMTDLIFWIGFLKSIGCEVVLQPWGDQFAYSPWMMPGDVPEWYKHPDSRLPLPDKREAMLESLADLLQFLRRDKGLTNITRTCLMCEPDNDHGRPVDPREFVRLNARLKQKLDERGLGGELTLLGPDDSSAPVNSLSLWFRTVMPLGHELFEGLSSHTYRHRDTRMLAPWIQSRLDMMRRLEPSRPPKPLLITEFGAGGSTFENPENKTYEYGLFVGDFAVSALAAGASSALHWCLFDTYYTRDVKQGWGLWDYRDAGWAPRPAFYVWAMICRSTRPGSRVVETEVAPAAPGLRATALVAPDGQLTLLAVNTYERNLTVDLCTGLDRPASLQVFRYTRQALEQANGQPFSPSDELATQPDKPVVLEMPARSFVVLTELPPLGMTN